MKRAPGGRRQKVLRMLLGFQLQSGTHGITTSRGGHLSYNPYENCNLALHVLWLYGLLVEGLSVESVPG